MSRPRIAATPAVVGTGSASTARCKESPIERSDTVVVSPRELHWIYELLFAHFGPQHWWPARTRDEVVIGAILTQNTAWRNVERAIENLRAAGALTLKAIDLLPVEELAQLIQPAGTYRIKATRLQKLTRWLAEEYGGSLDRLFAEGADAARRNLLEVPGIGPETADAILLYAGHLPTFVVDAYTLRLLRRHHLADSRAGYDEAKALFEAALPPDAGLFSEYHALLIAVGKSFCRKRATCTGCPLEHLPHDARR